MLDLASTTGAAMSVTDEVSAHYSRSGIEAAVVEALKAKGKDPERFTTDDLEGADELHFGWHPATLAVARSAGLAAGHHVLDVGSGIGGPARTFAEQFGCRVTGVDLSPDFVAAATGLTRRCGLSDRVVFHRADATRLPFADATFDLATMIHVGMNLPDKRSVFAEVRRALEPGGLFVVYDLMRLRPGDIRFPVPWAETGRTSFVETLETYRNLLADCGFAVERETSRAEMALAMMRERRARLAIAPPSGLHAMLGPASPERMANAMWCVESGMLAPIELIARAV